MREIKLPNIGENTPEDFSIHRDQMEEGRVMLEEIKELIKIEKSLIQKCDDILQDNKSSEEEKEMAREEILISEGRIAELEAMQEDIHLGVKSIKQTYDFLTKITKKIDPSRYTEN